MNTIGYFEIQASDTDRAIRFYSTLFGWKFTRQEGLPIPYYHIETGNIRGGLLQRPAQVPPAACGTNAYICSVQVASFDAVSAAVQAAGGRIALPKFAVPGRCWQGYFIDPDENTFGIFEVDDQAASGTHLQGQPAH